MLQLAKEINQAKRDAQINSKRVQPTTIVKKIDTKMEEEKVSSVNKKSSSNPAAGKVTITLTYGDQAENHRGMQKIGELADEGFSIQDLEEAKARFEAKGCKCELVNLNEGLNGTGKTGDSAKVLIVRNAMNLLDTSKLSADKLFDEQIKLKWDTKAFMYGRVVNKHARSNLCYAEEAQKADYENGKGTVVAYKTIPCTSLVRELLGEYLGAKGKNLMCEGNLYYDVDKCGIGFHGDTERKKVVAVRLGAKLSLHYQWFCNSEPVGERIKLTLNHGDLYVMSEKATGFDWKSKKISTLRHAAGCEKFLKIKVKKASSKPKTSKRGKKGVVESEESSDE